MSQEIKKILVTGGAGFIGSHIVDELIREKGLDPKAEIVVVDNFIRGRKENLAGALRSGRVKIVEGDIRDRALLAKLMAGTDIVFHMAALRITHCAAEPRQALEVMVDAMFDLCQAAVDAHVKKVVAASSASIYGLARQFPTTEDESPYSNRTLYGAAKLFNEGLLRSFNDMHGLKYVALRYFNVYGPRMDIHGFYTEVLIRWMDRIIEGKPPLIYGDGKQTMDFVFVKDVARANILAAFSGVSDDVFNVASGKEVSLNELARALAKVMGSDLEPEYAAERKVNPVPRRLASTEKARRILNFEVEWPLEEGLRDMVDWWRKERGLI